MMALRFQTFYGNIIINSYVFNAPTVHPASSPSSIRPLFSIKIEFRNIWI